MKSGDKVIETFKYLLIEMFRKSGHAKHKIISNDHKTSTKQQTTSKKSVVLIVQAALPYQRILWRGPSFTLLQKVIFTPNTIYSEIQNESADSFKLLAKSTSVAKKYLFSVNPFTY
jgi:hypothetical protein